MTFTHQPARRTDSLGEYINQCFNVQLLGDRGDDTKLINDLSVLEKFSTPKISR